jgi:hypothetical protein
MSQSALDSVRLGFYIETVPICNLSGIQPVKTRATSKDFDLAELLIWAGPKPVGSDAVNAVRSVRSLL